MLLPVYNEGTLLRYSLENTIKYVDEIVVVDGGPEGPSNDKTKDIIDGFGKLYPNKINYFSGTFRRENGSWDEGASRNLGLSNITGDILMPHCGDMIYTDSDITKMVNAVKTYPDKRIIYCPFVEFWLDQTQIRLYGGHAMEAWFPVLAISDIPFVALDLIAEYRDGPHLILKEYTYKDFLFVPNAFRYHYGWVSGFQTQVNKHIRNITMGAWAEQGDEIMKGGPKGVAKWAVKHVLSYPDMNCGYTFAGTPPINTKFTYLDGANESILEYKAKYGGDFLDD